MKRFEVKTSPLSLLSVSGFVSRASDPKRQIKASSSVASAALALPLRVRRHRGHAARPWAEAHGTLLDLPALDPVDALHGFRIQAQGVCNRAVARITFTLDDLLDSCGQQLVDLFTRR